MLTVSFLYGHTSLGTVSDRVRFFARFCSDFLTGTRKCTGKKLLCNEWCVGLEGRPTQMGRKNELLTLLSGFDTPSQLLPAITAVTNMHNYYNEEIQQHVQDQNNKLTFCHRSSLDSVATSFHLSVNKQLNPAAFKVRGKTPFDFHAERSVRKGYFQLGHTLKICSFHSP